MNGPSCVRIGTIQAETSNKKEIHYREKSLPKKIRIKTAVVVVGEHTKANDPS